MPTCSLWCPQDVDRYLRSLVFPNLECLARPFAPILSAWPDLLPGQTFWPNLWTFGVRRTRHTATLSTWSSGASWRRTLPEAGARATPSPNRLGRPNQGYDWGADRRREPISGTLMQESRFSVLGTFFLGDYYTDGTGRCFHFGEKGGKVHLVLARHDPPAPDERLYRGCRDQRPVRQRPLFRSAKKRERELADRPLTATTSCASSSAASRPPACPKARFPATRSGTAPPRCHPTPRTPAQEREWTRRPVRACITSWDD